MTSDGGTTAPARGSAGLVPLALLLGALFGMGGLGSTALAVVLPSAAEALDVSITDATWLISVYVLTMAVSTPVYGRLVDMLGVRVPLLVGVGLMTTGALLAATASSFEVMLGARLLQGLGTGVGATLGAAVLSSRFEGAERVRGLAIAAGTAAAVGATGPLLGGVTEAVATWRGTTALPALCLVILVLLWRRVEGPGSGSRFDVPGAVLVALAAGGIIMLIQSPSSGAVVAVAGAVLTLLATPLVVRRSSRGPHVFLPASVLRHRDLVRTCLVGGVLPAGWFALLVAVPARLAENGWSPARVGLVLLPSVVASLLVPRYAARATNRWGAPTSLALAAGLALAALVIAGLGARLTSVAGSTVALVSAVAIISGGFSLGQPAMFSIVGEVTDLDVRGVAMGFATLVFLTCGSAGSALVGGLADVAGPTAGIFVLAVLAGGAVVVARSLPGTASRERGATS